MPIHGLQSGTSLPLLETAIDPERCNSLGHMRAAQYVALFDDAFLEFIRLTGLTEQDLRHGTTSPFLLDLHATYLRELRPGDRVAISVQVLAQDQRRARVILMMHALANAGGGGSAGAGPAAAASRALVATCELAILNMDMAQRRPVPWSAAQAPVWAELMAAHGALPVPPQAGRAIGPLEG